MSTPISARDLDRSMRKVVNVQSVPTHNGGSRGAMEARIAPGSDDQHQASQVTHRGAPVYDEQEIGQRNFYGSASVVSLSELEQLDASKDPNVVKVQPPKPGTPIVAAAPPAAAAAVSPKQAPRSLAQILGAPRRS